MVTFPKKSLDQLDPIFMYTQIIKEVLLTIEFNDEHIKQYTDYCRDVLAENDTELKKMDKLQTEYHTRTPIWWYTFETFLYPILNRALRLMDMNIIIKMGFFVVDLHRDIEQLHSEQFTGNSSNKIFTVFRGQGMSKTDFDKMKNTKGGLMSFNNFLSTSKNRRVPVLFAESNSGNPDLVGILFVMTIDPMKSTTPFASVIDVGYYGDTEDEVLFSMHTVFRIDEITSTDKNQRLFQVQLTLTSDDDKDLRVLTDLIREETAANGDGWHRLGTLLLKVGEFTRAQQVYEILLEQTTDVHEKGIIYSQLGTSKYYQGEYNEAITFHEKALEIMKTTLLPTDYNMATCYSNISHVYNNMGDHSKALSYYENTFEIRNQSLPRNHPDLAPSYTNIGNVYNNMGDYPKALSYYKKALESREQSNPSNHPDLGMFYNNIGRVYANMCDYPKALLNHEKALEIRKQSLPPNDPELGDSYNNIGSMYANMGDYPKALSHYKKALEIREQSNASNHPDLDMFYNNIGRVYANMVDYPKALSYYVKALDIRKQSLPSNDPQLSDSYDNIGNMYYKMADYLNAVSNYEKALEIKKQSVPSNHVDLATSYNSIADVYSDMGDYSKALSNHEKALEIRKQSVAPNDPDLASSYNSIGVVYYNMGDYAKASSFYERAVAVGEQSLLTNDPDLQLYKDNLDIVKKQL